MKKTFTLSAFALLLSTAFFSLPIWGGLGWGQSYLWAKNIGSTSGYNGSSIAVDASGNCYIIGTFSGTADFDPGAGSANLTAVGSYDIFFARYDNYVGIDEQDMSLELRVFPTPCSAGEATISYSLPAATKVTIQITDVTGNKIATPADDEKQIQGAHSLKYQFNERGVYFIFLKTKMGFAVRKQIIL